MDLPTEVSTEKVAVGVHSYRNKMKKRKKKFIANAKGFGKSGNYGRGTRLEGDEWSYFINIMDAIRQGFESLDDKVSMANNVFEQTVDKEIHISSNQIACTILEHLMPYVDSTTLERFHKTFSENYRPICSDKFSSHILQKLIEVSFLRAVGHIQAEEDTETQNNSKKQKTAIIPNEKEYNLSESFSLSHRQDCTNFVIKSSKFLLNNLEDFVWDSYACHVIRTSLLSLAGIFVFKTKDFVTSNQRRSVTADKEMPLKVPDDWAEIMKEYADRLQAWPQFVDFPYDELSSGLLQSLCLALQHSDKTTLKHLGKKLLNESLNVECKNVSEDAKDDKDDIDVGDRINTNLPKVFTTEPSIRLLETLLLTAGPKLLTQIYLKLFSSRLIELSDLKSANFAVQKLLENITVKEDFEAIFDELSPNIENLLRTHTGVVHALSQACLRLCAKQGPFVQSLQTALHCTTPKEKSDRFAVLVMKLKPYEIEAKDKSSFVHLHGSLILQALLNFNKPIKLVQSLLDTPSIELAELFCSPRGSHIVDAFLQSKFVGEKSREKFVKHMDGQYLDMAITKHGSRAVEALFEAAGDNQRTRIVKELAEKINQLNGSPSGRLLNYKFRVDTYRLSPAQWKSSINKESKIEKLFKRIVD
ncbi:Nucleolar protein 9 [Pseudolycoriella hygida]|uniref:Nucleolar protein 9 n=1 Tax=Pseudolycoriella hygida TaxID=35572 RepID=A0A9Q0NBC6_9DIPT|nr:Nucleolar protein 9 [Pseudolycoriella hygida]